MSILDAFICACLGKLVHFQFFFHYIRLELSNSIWAVSTNKREIPISFHHGSGPSSSIRSSPRAYSTFDHCPKPLPLVYGPPVVLRAGFSARIPRFQRKQNQRRPAYTYSDRASPNINFCTVTLMYINYLNVDSNPPFCR